MIFIGIRIFSIPWNFSLIHNLCVLAPCFTTWQRVLSAAKIFWSSTVIFHSVASMIYKEKDNEYNYWRDIKLIFQIVTGKQHCSSYQLTIHPQTRDLCLTSWLRSLNSLNVRLLSVNASLVDLSDLSHSWHHVRQYRRLKQYRGLNEHSLYSRAWPRALRVTTTTIIGEPGCSFPQGGPRYKWRANIS